MSTHVSTRIFNGLFDSYLLRLQGLNLVLGCEASSEPKKQAAASERPATGSLPGSAKSQDRLCREDERKRQREDPCHEWLQRPLPERSGHVVVLRCKHMGMELENPTP